MFLCAISIHLHAQDFSNFRLKKITVDNDTIILDTLSLIPKSIIITTDVGLTPDTSKYFIDYVNGMLIFTDKNYYENELKNTNLNISYRVFPILFSAVRSHKKSTLINDATKEIKNPFLYQYKTTTEDVFKWGLLNRSGNISRGVSFGNNQDLVVNSSLNLQLSGYLSENIQVLAAITDNNIPIQPDGNTQQIQEFDKVFIQLFNKNNKLIAGDFEINRPPGYFMNFYKKAQGVLIESNLILSSKKRPENEVKLKLEGSGALSKGRYARNVLAVVEGNQGPYKLMGNNNETYIIILAGTERVYIDGILLTRGQENDYVIDYNTGEVSFTPKNMITKDKRVVVEFEYTDRYYARTMFFAGVGMEYKKLNVRFNFFSEQDLKNQPLLQELSDSQKQLLSDIGDSVQAAIVPNIDSLEFSNTYVMYKMIDTVVNLVIYDSVFVYSTNPDSAFYRLGFSYVGSGKGNYVLSQSSANGRVFKWVAPQGGNSSGDYEPLTFLIAPKKNQMYSLALDYAIGKTTRINVEGALSIYDKNLFSSLNKKDDIGYALKTSVNNSIPFAKKSKNEWKLIADISNEWVSRYFNPIEQYRPVEFMRDWNLTNNLSADENISGLKFGVQNNKNQNAIYQFKYYTHGSSYQGLLNQLDVNGDWKNFFLTFSGSYLNTSTPNYKTIYFKQKAHLVKKFKWFSLGVREEQEHNTFKPDTTQTLIANSFAFNIYEAYFGSPDTAKNKYYVSYKKRFDYLPVENKLVLASDADDINLNVDLAKNPRHIFKVRATYRMLKLKDTTISTNKPENILLGRLEYYTNFAKKVFQSTTYYEVGSGMEEKKEYSYIEVPAGQGIYTWSDYNSDGIKQINEFEIAAFTDQANYIRVFTPTNDYIKTYSNGFSEVLNIEPANAWKNKTGLRKIISRFGLLTTYSVAHKSTNVNLLQAYNPFYFRADDTTLMTLSTVFKSVLFFNKNNPKIAAEVSYQFNNSKLLLLNGYEIRSQEFVGSKVRWNITRKFYTNIQFEIGRKKYDSEYFFEKNYTIDSWKVEPKFIFQPGNKFRTSLTYVFSDKKNIEAQPLIRAVTHNFGLEGKYNFPGKGTLQAKANYINIAFNADENTSVAYEMLNGFRRGQNITWGLSFQYNLGNNIQLDIIYDGRKMGENKIIHVGSVQVRAYF
ncbi:MAG: hypothetical protein PHR81_05640 [Bacteroidales bacterium]|nr:hypothetical protein [Bacteroidales bacterium]